MGIQIEKIIDEPLSKKVIKGGVWVFSLRILNRSLGFIRTIILARLLAPEDFGLLGVAMLSISILETFSQTGFQTALIQIKNNIESYLNTAWTVSAIRGVILFLLLFFSAPIIAGFFNSPQAVLIIRVIAASTLISGFRNIGIVYFQKELEFNKQFFYEFSATVVDLSVAISLAFLLRNVWALVWGGIAANIVRLFMSYILQTYRPRISFNKEKFIALFGFGRWVLGSSILIFLLTHGDDILLGKILGVAALGFYQMAYTISNMPATELTHMISQVTFPAYSKMQDDLPKLGTAFLKVLRLIALFSFFFAGAILALCPEFIRLFLGDKWMPAVPAIQILTVFGVTRSINGVMGQILYGTGNPNILTKLSGIQLILMAIIIYPLMRWAGIVGTCLSVIIPNLFILILIIIESKNLLSLEYKDILDTISAPLLSAIAMVTLVLIIKKTLLPVETILFFLLFILLCTSIYFSIVIVTDRLNHNTANSIREVLNNLKINNKANK